MTSGYCEFVATVEVKLKLLEWKFMKVHLRLGTSVQRGLVDRLR